ncbi:hypothetical protein [Streptomyces sp. NPDC046261]|uniref:hypothetical protein n=1 Tax=Streptomyces sp. NPDC046261 TaxID=3157200 RepID=UPI003405241C
MAEHDADRDRDESRDPLDEDRAWAELVAAYGEQPDPDKGRWPASGDIADTPRSPAGAEGPDAPEPSPKSAGAPEPGTGPAGETPEEPDAASSPPSEPATPSKPARPGSFIVYAPGVGPRDWSASEDADEEDAPDEGHFVPPEPPPLPTGDVTSRFAWIAVLGGPLLLLVMVLLRQELTWWVTTLGVGGFLGGFATLVLRMKDGDDEEDDDPGRGAVV